jgi:hypothetical protein
MAAAKGRDAVIADQGAINEALGASDCMKNKDLLCVSKTLGLYPGVRMLVLIEALQVSEQTPAKALARVSLVDTGLPFRYPLMEVAADVQSKKSWMRFWRTSAPKYLITPCSSAT